MCPVLYKCRPWVLEGPEPWAICDQTGPGAAPMDTEGPQHRPFLTLNPWPTALQISLDKLLAA